MVIYGYRESESNEDLSDSHENDFHVACATGDITLVRAFMGACNCRALLEECDSKGRTPLRVAIDHEQCEVASELLNQEDVHFDVNAQDERGWTALAGACAYIQNETILRLLVEAGSDLNWQDENGMNLLSLARSKGNQTAVRFLENLLNLPATETPNGETQHVTNDHDASSAHGEVCTICETAVVDVTLAPCEHRTCYACSQRWKRCHVTLLGSICGIACGSNITGRRRILTFSDENIGQINSDTGMDCDRAICDDT